MLPKNIQKLIQVTAGENATDAETVLKSIININLIAFGDNGINDPGCRENIIDFLGRKDLWRSIDKLFIETFGELAGQFEHLTWLQKAEALSGKRALFINGSQPIYPHLYFNHEQGLYINLKDDITLDKDTIVDRDFFGYFFAFRLSKRDLGEVISFLIVNYHAHFQEETVAYIDFLRRQIIPQYRKMLGKARIENIRAYIKKLTRKAPYVKVKVVKIKTRALEEFFSSEYNGAECAVHFRQYVIHKLIVDKAISNLRIKQKIRIVTDLLKARKIWRDDLELATIADTLKKEFRIDRLSSKVFQGESPMTDPNIEAAFNKINWPKSTRKNPLSSKVS